MIRDRARGLTLVELLVALALTVVIVGVAAFASIQVQRTISLANAREDAARSARGVFTDLDQDLARLVVCVRAPKPFDQLPAQYPQKPLVLELGGSPSGPPGTPRPAAQDTIRLLTSIHAPEGGEALERALVEYSLEPPRDQPGGGPKVSRIMRKLLYWAKIDPTKPVNDPQHLTLVSFLAPAGGTGTAPPLNFPIADNLTSLQVEWCPAAKTVFQDPDPTTKTGVAFCFEGQVNLALPGLAPSAGEPGPTSPNLAFTLNGADPGGTSLVNAIPVGAEVRLNVPNVNPPTSATYVVRRKLSDRVFVNDRVDMLRPPEGPYATGATAFIPPALLRVTLVFSIGKGPEGQQTRYTRTFTVLE